MSEVDYDDLDELQKQALIDAFGEPSNYEAPLFSEADATEVGGYSNLRTKLEGLDVNRGNIDSERLEYFTGENGNILKETDEGEYEVNSIWDSWMLEEMEEKDMIDSSQFSFYKAENLEDTDMSVLEVDGSFYVDIEDGVTFSLGSAETVEDAEYDSAEKVQHMTQEFIKQFACEEDEEPGDTGYMNNISSKSEEISNKGGDNNMTEDYDSLEEVNKAVIDGELTDLGETKSLVSEYVSDNPGMAEVYLAASTLKYQELQTGENLTDYLDGENGPMAEIVGDIQEDISGVSSAVATTASNAREQISRLEDTEEELRHAYVTHLLENSEAWAEAAERNESHRETVEGYTEELEEIAQELEDVSSESFDSTTDEEIREELAELRDVSGLSSPDSGSN